MGLGEKEGERVFRTLRGIGKKWEGFGRVQDQSGKKVNTKWRPTRGGVPPEGWVKKLVRWKPRRAQASKPKLYTK